MEFTTFMPLALQAARKALALGEVPVGTVIFDHVTQTVIAETHNLVYRQNDPTLHAEIAAIRIASDAITSPYLDNCDLYSTLEPCAMCAQAIAWSRIKRVYYALSDPKSGGVEHGAKIFQHSHHKPEIYSGFMAQESAELLQQFFSSIRESSSRSNCIYTT